MSATLLSIFAQGRAWADESTTQEPTQTSATVEFDEQFFNTPNSPATSKLDISRLNKGNIASPGNCHAALYVNQVWIGVMEVSLREQAKRSGNVQPCFNHALLERMNVDINLDDDFVVTGFYERTAGIARTFVAEWALKKGWEWVQNDFN